MTADLPLAPRHHRQQWGRAKTEADHALDTGPLGGRANGGSHVDGGSATKHSATQFTSSPRGALAAPDVARLADLQESTGRFAGTALPAHEGRTLSTEATPAERSVHMVLR